MLVPYVSFGNFSLPGNRESAASYGQEQGPFSSAMDLVSKGPGTPGFAHAERFPDTLPRHFHFTISKGNFNTF